MQLARFVRDVLGVDDNDVRQANRNFERSADLTHNQIAVGALGAAMRLSGGERFDGDAEQMTHSNTWRQACTLDFYGQDNFDWAHRFINLATSQRGRELQSALGLTVYRASAITDLEGLLGQQFDPRYQVELNVMITFETTEPVLRIDTAQFQVWTEDGLQAGSPLTALTVNGELLLINGQPLLVAHNPAG